MLPSSLLENEFPFLWGKLVLLRVGLSKLMAVSPVVHWKATVTQSGAVETIHVARKVPAKLSPVLMIYLPFPLPTFHALYMAFILLHLKLPLHSRQSWKMRHSDPRSVIYQH